MSDHPEQQIHVHVQLSLGEVVQAAVHRRIQALGVEIEKTGEAFRAARNVAENHWEDVSEYLCCNAPPKAQVLIDAAYELGAVNVFAGWDESSFNGGLPVYVDFEVEAPKNRSKPGLCTGFKFQTSVGEFDAKAKDLLLENIGLRRVEHGLEEELRRLQNMRDDRNLRQNLEGEMLAQMVEKSAPQIASHMGVVAAMGLLTDNSKL